MIPLTGREILESEEARRFMACFDMPDPFDNIELFVDALRQSDPRYQGSRPLVRYELEQDDSTWSTPTVDIIMDAARYMRMLEPETPIDDDFDVMIVLGGARQSNLDRMRYAAKMVTDRNCLATIIVAAGSTRKLADAEKKDTSDYAPCAETEFDLCAAAAKLVAVEKQIITSQFMVDNEKAGTPDVIAAVFDNLIHGRATVDSMAAVTNQIYQLSTEWDIARAGRQYLIPFTAAAGCPSDPQTVANRKTSTYLSEVLRTLRAAVRAAEVGV